jgi:hypothetical protein
VTDEPTALEIVQAQLKETRREYAEMVQAHATLRIAASNAFGSPFPLSDAELITLAQSYVISPGVRRRLISSMGRSVPSVDTWSDQELVQLACQMIWEYADLRDS